MRIIRPAGIDAPIYVNRHFGRWFGHEWTAQRAEDLPYHEALEAANDLGLAFSFRRAATDVVDRGLVAPHPHDAVGGGVGLSVATAVEPVVGDLAARGGGRAGGAQARTPAPRADAA